MIESDPVFMKRALDQARRGAGLVSPNPMVGALLVKGGRVVGEGFHRYDLLKHGETYAIEMAGLQARGATLYCNLEPCCHHGRTPPCTDALVEAGISRAVIATKDPYVKVSGRGIEQLREAKHQSRSVSLESARLNESYFKFVTSSMPLYTAS
jgi:diaminohydroxyphosphoribosylaminopyrimidine deaminase/5-amino-6-(5-phosphoribosylamino)uracil reductase